MIKEFQKAPDILVPIVLCNDACESESDQMRESGLDIVCKTGCVIKEFQKAPDILVPIVLCNDACESESDQIITTRSLSERVWT